MISESIVIFGASSGLGLGLSCGLPEKNEKVYLISRTRPASLDRNDGINRNWIKSDLSAPDGISVIKNSLKNVPIKLIVYCAGTWESSSNLKDISIDEVYEIMNVNTSSFVASIISLENELQLASKANIIAISSTAGLENATGPRAVYSASKFGIRGAIHGLRSYFRNSFIGTTCISPGGLASDISYDDGIDMALDKYNKSRIPTEDIIKIIRLIMTLSIATCVKEIDLPAMRDRDA